LLKNRCFHLLAQALRFQGMHSVKQSEILALRAALACAHNHETTKSGYAKPESDATPGGRSFDNPLIALLSICSDVLHVMRDPIGCAGSFWNAHNPLSTDALAPRDDNQFSRDRGRHRRRQTSAEDGDIEPPVNPIDRMRLYGVKSRNWKARKER
jgi:hypothetical protein